MDVVSRVILGECKLLLFACSLFMGGYGYVFLYLTYVFSLLDGSLWCVPVAGWINDRSYYVAPYEYGDTRARPLF